MRIRLTLTNSKNSVHHQHALLSPIGKLAVIRDRDTKISIKFFKIFCKDGGGLTPALTENKDHEPVPDHGKDPVQ